MMGEIVVRRLGRPSTANRLARFVALALSGVMASLATACLLTTDLEKYTSEADASAADGGREGSAPGTRACDAPGLTFCADFDDGAKTRALTLLPGGISGGAGVVDSARSVSAPNSMVFELQKGTSDTFRMLKEDVVVRAGLREVNVGASIYLDIDSLATVGRAYLLVLSKRNNANQIVLAVTVDGLAIVDRRNDKDTSTYPAPVVPPLKKWFRAEMKVTEGATPSCALTMDHAPSPIFTHGIAPLSGGWEELIELRAGIPYVIGATDRVRFALDDVTLRGE